MDTSKKMAAGLTGLASMLWLGLTAAVAANQRRLVFNPTLEREVTAPALWFCARKTARAWPAG
jgi:hypothetical protein